MELSNVTENAVVAGTDGGRGIANLNYILYIAGFFTGITALIGVILAYLNRGKAAEPYRAHLKWQIHIFWRGVLFGVADFCLYVLITVIGAFTLGFGFILLLLPVALGVWWLVWTIMAIARGMQALGRGEAIPQ